jgi:hypothetical protein
MWAMSELNEMGCEQFADVAAELALGVLTGRERAEAIAHLDGCEACRENVRQLTTTGEELLGLLPAIEPPAGFETRVMDRLGLAAPRPGLMARLRKARRAGRTVNRTRRMLAVAAVTLAVVVSGLGGWGLGSSTVPSASPPSAGSLLSTASLVSPSHQPVGKIFMYSGNPRWLYMSVDVGSGGTGTVTCELVGRDGHVVSLGKFRLNGGYGAWGSPPPLERGPFTGARLVSSDGMVLATASFFME